jgi:PTH1 family peptidyl-tRNA hydrolase
VDILQFLFGRREQREPVTHLVAGLGNPGVQYVRTRHNVGFRIVDAFARAHEATAWRAKFRARIAHAADCGAMLVMPQTYMNDSGDSIGSIAGYYKVAPQNILVVCDDIALPFATLRMRRGGSSGGHNGLKSIIHALQTEEFPRLRVGVGRSSPDAIGTVLGAFSEIEERALDAVIHRAVSGIETFLHGGIEAAIAQVNADGGGSGKESR